ncbi:ABC-F family ATP-binding cassette domain-containing protein [Alicyclobacillus acidiphilus]|uniref:ABC-F family ATP-binding cassette domain-containing protein n=1 Tax=Alicyclobacillus acidiphilus TaxID=182455 RepID=UPI00082F70D9|nr:ABC-F family ATP-binding cassette domain-containing protein [Alicyclobacillus acidiphilus]
MNIVSAEHLQHSYGDKVLLRDVTFGIEERDRIGLIGVNGAGKSTLLKIVAGLVRPDAGSVTVAGNVRVHYLPQEPSFGPDDTVIQAVFAGEAPVMELLRAYERALDKLAKDPQDEVCQGQVLNLQSQLEAVDGWAVEHEAKAILTRLGITRYDQPVAELSGGWKKRVALARALIQPAELLILDEPTNHIDGQTVEWLENYLQARTGALLMITHDRHFLDRVVNRIFELDRGRLYEYRGKYEQFLEGKLARQASEQASVQKRENFLRNELEWVKRGPRARGTKQKARLDRYYDVLEQEPEAANGDLQLSAASARLGKSIFELDHVSKRIAGKKLLNDFSYIAVDGDRIGVVGPNGSGKSTLLRLIKGELEPDSGEVRIGATVRYGYYGQETTPPGDLDTRVIDVVRDIATVVETTDGELVTASQMLERFLFPPDVQWTPVAKLSGGERRRLELLRILMSAPNVLLLDEPTNDLDIPTLQVLESYLDGFPGVVIAVSHDRYFLDRIANKILAFEGDGIVSLHYGNMSDYLAVQAARMSSAEVTDSGNAADVQLKTVNTRSRRRDTLRFTYQEQREYERIEDDIAAAEQEARRIEAEMERFSHDHVRLAELFEEQRANEQRLAFLMERWAYLTDLAERIEAQKAADKPAD